MNEPETPAGDDCEATRWERALSAQSAGDFLRAAALFAACPPDPVRGDAQARFQAGWCLEQARQPQQAAGHYTGAAESAREPALATEALFRLGWLALAEHDMEGAGRHLARVVDLAATHGLTGPTIEHARFWATVCIENDGRLLDAAARYRAIAEEGNPDLWHEAAYRRLLCLSQVGDLDGALGAADALLRPRAAVRDPTRLTALQDLAREERAQIARARAAA